MDHFPNQFSETSLNRFDAPDQSLQLDVLAKTEGVAVILEINEEAKQKGRMLKIVWTVDNKKNNIGKSRKEK